MGRCKDKNDTDFTCSPDHNERTEAEFGIRAWWRTYTDSIDGLPGLRSCFDAERPLEYADAHSTEGDEAEDADADEEAKKTRTKEHNLPEMKVNVIHDKADRDYWVIVGFTLGLVGAALMETGLTSARSS
jgi:hypothetical protein